MVRSILIYGRGFVGTALFNYLLDSGFKVLLRSLDTSADIATERDFLSRNQIDYVINATGGSSVGNSVARPIDDFDSNVKTVAYLVRLLEDYNDVNCLLHFSSAAVYGDQCKESESYKLSPYAEHKRLAEYILLNSLQESKLCIVRPFSIYGVGLRKQVVWDAIEKIQKSEGEILFYGTGFEKRSFVNIKSVLSHVTCLLDNDLRGIHDIHGGAEHTISDLVNIICSILGFDGDVSFNGDVYDMSPRILSKEVVGSCNAKESGELDLINGIQEIIKWKENE